MHTLIELLLTLLERLGLVYVGDPADPLTADERLHLS